MNTVIFTKKNEFNKKQQADLTKLGQVRYSNTRRELTFDELISLAKGAEILGLDPDNFGGFEKASARVTQLCKALPNLKGIALSTTSHDWIDKKFFGQRDVPICHIPHANREAVAEHVLALLLCLSKRIIEIDRKTQKGEYALELGFELKGKTLGIIGLGDIGSRVAELGLAIGMNVIAYNRSFRKQVGVQMVGFDDLLKRSDAISLNLTDSPENKNLVNTTSIVKLKDGVIIVNTVDRSLVNEKAMSDALKSGKVFAYAYEAENLINTPLYGIDRAIGLQGFGWYTKETVANISQTWTNNILSLAKGKPQNVVS